MPEHVDITAIGAHARASECCRKTMEHHADIGSDDGVLVCGCGRKWAMEWDDA